MTSEQKQRRLRLLNAITLHTYGSVCSKYKYYNYASDPNLLEVALQTRKLSSKQAEAGRQVTQFAEEFESVGPREMRNAK